MQEKQEDGINHFTDSILPFLNKKKTTTKKIIAQKHLCPQWTLKYLLHDNRYR